MSHLQTIYEERFTPDFWQIPEDDTVLKLMSALRERSYPGIYAALRKLKEPLSGDNAASCLVNALSCTIRAFAAVLDHCAPGEYASSLAITLAGTSELNALADPPKQQERLRCDVSGTILTLAAALDNHEVVALLLERGWDPNSSSLTSRSALLQHALNHFYHINQDTVLAARQAFSGICTSSQHSTLTISDPGERFPFENTLQLTGVTPLAAALATGSFRCVDLLLQRSDVWKTECPAVGTAAAYAWGREEITYQLCSSSLLLPRQGNLPAVTPADCLHADNLPLLKDLLKKAPPDRKAVSVFWLHFIAPNQLPRETGPCRTGREMALLMMRYAPDLAALPVVRSAVFSLAVASFPGQETLGQKLLNGMIRCGGGALDLTPHLPMLEMRSAALVKEILLPLSKQVELTLDRNQVPSGSSISTLRLLARVARLTPAIPGSMSSFAQAVLNTGSLALLRDLYRKGLLDGESGEAMLEYLPLDSPLRPLVLIHCVQGKERTYEL